LRYRAVEIDTRNLILDGNYLAGVLDIMKAVADKHFPHTVQFSPNLSVHASLAIEWTQKIADIAKPPIILKVDGGLDGLSTCQALRKHFSGLSVDQRPIITCYPLLRRQLQSVLPKYVFSDRLVLSGADIIYPGGCPSFPNEDYRTIDRQALRQGVDHYRRIVKRRWPMPTVAGVSTLARYKPTYELLGPDVAYFIGGGVALHKDGPVKGARLCVKALDKALDNRDRAKRHGNPLPEDFEGTLAMTANEYHRPSWMPKGTL
jgi:ribulose 1,5-bisphosphate carboxylase large subunit-like protein